MDDPPNEMLFHVIPHEYAQEIVHIISGCARLEYEIDTVIWELAGFTDNPNIGACLTAQFPTVNIRINALIALARVQKIPAFQISKLNRFRDKATAIADKRNRVAHDPWMSAYGDNLKPLEKMYRLQKTARAKLEHEYKHVPLDELKALRKEIETALAQFNDLRSEVLQTFWSLP